MSDEQRREPGCPARELCDELRGRDTSARRVIKAVVFDFDGVIANSEPLHFAAFRDVLRDAGVTFTEQEYYAAYLGYDDAGVFRAVARARKQPWSTDDIARLIG